AVADLVDNSITAGASNVRIDLAFDGARSWIRIADDGSGMSPKRITEALRYGSDETYGTRDLGKFGLGLKTASMSQCRRLTVASRTRRGPVSIRRLDLDHVTQSNRWEIADIAADDQRLNISSSSGTVVLWESLDRVLQYKDPDGEWARAGLRALADRTDQHLGMVLHRFLDGSARRPNVLKLMINGTQVDAWDPFARDEPATTEHDSGDVYLVTPTQAGMVRYGGWVLPPREKFSSEVAFRRAGGPKKWNRQQGFYIYRADRMIQSGGWSWMRTADEHTKLARMSIDFLPELDGAFGINVAKVRVTLPAELRDHLAAPVASLVKAAQAAYRDKAASDQRSGSKRPVGDGSASQPSGGNGDVSELAMTLRSAAEKVKEEAALGKIAEQVRRDSPEVARAIGW
ncbi:MAG TPA: ATP-binding protein, partial [Nitrospira sp.]|nr:ATP-binding protein [Nitrospira sp.]